MRRGLMRWDPEELPTEVLYRRIARLQAAMKRDFDALLLYTNLTRPSAVSYLTGFTPYWSEGILLMPTAGAPVFATALSKRVASWIRATDPISEIVNSSKPGAAVAERLAAGGARRIGVVELDNLPSMHCDALIAGAPVIELTDASALFAASRSPIDAAEHSLLRHADAIAMEALGHVGVGEVEDASAIAARVEQHARLRGAEEAYIVIAPDLLSDRRMIRVSRPAPLAARFALCASIAYKGNWIRRTRTFAADAAGRSVVGRCNAWFERVIRSIRPDQPLSIQLTTFLDELPDTRLQRWMAESCVGSYPLQTIATSGSPGGHTPADGSFLVLTIELTIGDERWLGGAPVFSGDCPSGARPSSGLATD